MAYTVEYRDGGFYMTLKGVMSLEEIDEANSLIMGSEKFDLHNFQIVHLLDSDFSQIEHTKANRTGAMDTASSRMRPNVRVAMIVSEPAAVEFCQEYVTTAQALDSTWEFLITADENEALAWAQRPKDSDSSTGYLRAIG